jgi:acetyl-CoA C-acetyltransferase
MADAFIYDHVRTPRGRGKPDGSLHEVSTLGLATSALKSLRERNNLDTKMVDDVVFGCVDPVGEAGSDVTRAAALAADYGDHVPGVQISRFCASGLDSVNFAAAQIMAGQHEMTIGGGVESMSRVGIGASGGAWPVDPSIAIKAYFMPQGVSADLIATKYGFSRDDVDAYAVESQKRAAMAVERGPLRPLGRAGARSQRPRHSRSRRAHAPRRDHAVAGQPETLLRDDGRTGRLRRRGAAIASGSREDQPRPSRRQFVGHRRRRRRRAARLEGSRRVKAGLKPRARIRAFCNIGSEPAIMLTGPVDVTKKLLAKHRHEHQGHRPVRGQRGLRLGRAALHPGLRRRPGQGQPNGGAIAMGHPLGATGAMILGTALDELERTGKSTALITLCIGAGMGTATIIERV